MKTSGLNVVGCMRAAICSGHYSLSDPAFIHFFFLFFFTFGSGEISSLPVFWVLSDVFPQASMQEAFQVGRPEPIAQEASLTQNFAITQAISSSPLNRAFSKNQFMPLPSQ